MNGLYCALKLDKYDMAMVFLILGNGTAIFLNFY
jgi:hypothetical protein